MSDEALAEVKDVLCAKSVGETSQNIEGTSLFEAKVPHTEGPTGLLIGSFGLFIYPVLFPRFYSKSRMAA